MQVLTDATAGEREVVQVEPVDPLLVGQEPEDNPSDRVGDSDDGQQEARVVLVHAKQQGAILLVDSFRSKVRCSFQSYNEATTKPGLQDFIFKIPSVVLM